MKIQTTELVTDTITVCDICHHDRRDGCYGFGFCHICGRDVCRKCAILQDNDMELLSDGGTYDCDIPDRYCPECWSTGREYREAIMQCRDKAEQAEEELWRKWKDAVSLGDKNANTQGTPTT